jgi:hypothetical protein
MKNITSVPQAQGSSSKFFQAQARKFFSAQA